MREIVTLQIGTAANHAAAHFWNTQYGYSEENIVDHELPLSVLFRPRSTRNYGNLSALVPRAVIVDYHDQQVEDSTLVLSENKTNENSASWDAETNLINRDPIKPSALRQYWTAQLRGEVSDDAPPPNIDSEEITSWFDYCYAEHDRNSVHLLPKLYNGDALAHAFDAKTAYRSFDWGETLVDSVIRREAEMCDNMQGFLWFSDTNGGFAELTSLLLTDVCDVYPKQDILLNTFSKECDSDWLNFASAAFEVSESRVLLLPWAMQANQNLYRASSLPAVSIESLTLMSRSSATGVVLGDLRTHLNSPIAISKSEFAIKEDGTPMQKAFTLLAGPSPKKNDSNSYQSPVVKVVRDKSKAFQLERSAVTRELKFTTSLEFPVVHPFPELQKINPFSQSTSSSIELFKKLSVHTCSLKRTLSESASEIILSTCDKYLYSEM